MDALKRFPAGLCLVWHPLLVLDGAGETLREALMALYSGNRRRVELITGDKRHAVGTKRGGLYGSGLAVCNPPRTLKAALEETPPFPADCVGGARGGYSSQWISRREIPRSNAQ
jgi:23S rRNA A2030 N6-methylase RlmJ